MSEVHKRNNYTNQLFKRIEMNGGIWNTGFAHFTSNSIRGESVDLMNVSEFLSFGSTSVNNSPNFEGDNLIGFLHDSRDSVAISFWTRAEAPSISALNSILYPNSFKFNCFVITVAITVIVACKIALGVNQKCRYVLSHSNFIGGK